MSFVVLACIGSCIMLFSVLRWLPGYQILILSIVSVMAVSFYTPDQFVSTQLGDYPINIFFYDAIINPSFIVIYPILPWIGLFGIGWFIGLSWEQGKILNGKLLIMIGLAGVILLFYPCILYH